MRYGGSDFAGIKSYGGAQTVSFSQDDAFRLRFATQHNSANHEYGTWNDQGLMYNLVLSGAKPYQLELGGVCFALSALWIAFHHSQATGGYGSKTYGKSSWARGKSLWEYLFRSHGLKFNMGAAWNIIAEQKRSEEQGVTQRVFLDSYMAEFGLVKRKKAMRGAPIAPPAALPLDPVNICRCAEEITRHNGYIFITLHSPHGGHAVAAWRDSPGPDGEIFFMDPNFGEFRLPNRKNFQKWFFKFFARTYRDHFKTLRYTCYIPKAPGS